MKLVNGQIVPENLSLDELKQMMESSDMQTFAVACEALALAKTSSAYEVLKKYIRSSDKYKRCCVMAVIYTYPYAVELNGEIERALQSDERLFVLTALDVVIKYGIIISDELVINTFIDNHGHLDRWYYQLLNRIEKSEVNKDIILKLYRSNTASASVKIQLAECLLEFADQENFMELFNLFKDDPQPHIRMVACRIAQKFEQRNLLQAFISDADGHVRKLAYSFADQSNIEG